MDIKIEKSNIAKLPTKHGNFNVICFKEYLDENNFKEHLVAYTSTLKTPPLVRVHSECLTGDAFGSLKCDCGPELAYALDKIYQNEKGGILIYLRQEGRDIGLFNKINAYNLQDKGYDTVEANLKLGLKADNRNYYVLEKIFDHFDLKEIDLLTNNPDKIEWIQKYVKVNRKEIIQGINKHNQNYIKIKKEKMKHMF